MASPALPLRRAELAGCALLLFALALVLYGSHVVRGGFAWDDWENAATTIFDGGPRFVGPFDVREALYEPGLGLLLPLPHLVFGTEPAWHLALAAVLGVALSLGLFALLRKLGLPWLAATLAALLALAFPWSDSTRLWATAGLNQVAACLYLAGALLALRALREPGGARHARLSPNPPNVAASRLRERFASADRPLSEGVHPPDSRPIHVVDRDAERDPYGHRGRCYGVATPTRSCPAALT